MSEKDVNLIEDKLDQVRQGILRLRAALIPEEEPTPDELKARRGAEGDQRRRHQGPHGIPQRTGLSPHDPNHNIQSLALSQETIKTIQNTARRTIIYSLARAAPTHPQLRKHKILIFCGFLVKS